MMAPVSPVFHVSLFPAVYLIRRSFSTMTALSKLGPTGKAKWVSSTLLYDESCELLPSRAVSPNAKYAVFAPPGPFWSMPGEHTTPVPGVFVMANVDRAVRLQEPPTPPGLASFPVLGENAWLLKPVNVTSTFFVSGAPPTENSPFPHATHDPSAINVAWTNSSPAAHVIVVAAVHGSALSTLL